MAETQVLGWGSGNAPLSRSTKAGERYEVLALEATVDGSGAAGTFVPAVQIVSDAGVVVGTFPLASSLAPGDSATITWAPFLRNGVGLTGIFYDLLNAGDWLQVTTTSNNIYPAAQGSAAGDPLGIVLDTGYTTNDMLLQAFNVFAEVFNDFWVESNGGSIKLVGPGGVTIDSAGGGTDIKSGGAALNVESQGGGLTIDDGGGSVTINATGELDIATAGTPVNISIGAGTSLTIHGTAGQPIFRANSAGDLHGQTGKTLTFDL